MKTRLFYAPLIALTITSIASISCFRPKGEVKFRLNIKTNQGEPINDAEIKLGGDEIGRSNQKGEWTQQLELPVGEKLRLEISKQSAVNYYAPDFLDFTIAKEGPQELKYDATLYFVPKPSPKDTNKKLEISAGNIENSKIPKSEAVVATQSEPTTTTTPSGTATASSSNDNNTLKSDDIPEEGKPVDEADFSDGLAGNEDAALSPVDESGKTDPINADISAVEPPANPAILKTPEDIVAPSSMLPKPPRITLNTIEEPNSSSQIPGSAYPKFTAVAKPKLIYTIQVADAKNPIAGVDIYVGREDQGDLKIGCQTNARGRCVIRFGDIPTDVVKFIARKSGYLTMSKSTRVGEQGILRFILEKGETIDIFTVSRSYGFASGVKDVEVLVAGKKVGITDTYGHFSYVYQGNHDDLLEVTLKNKLYLPEEYQADFVVSGPMALTRYFTPKQPGPAKITFLRAQPAGKPRDNELKSFNPEMDIALRKSARSHFFSSNTFSEYSLENFETELRDSGISMADMLAKGWQQSDFKGKVDAVILPTIVTGENPILEISVIDSNGTTIAAAKEDLENLSDKTAIDHSIASLAKKILQVFPFEGSILSKKGDTAQINLGKNSNKFLRIGDVFDVYGNQSAKMGNKTENAKIATLKISSMDDQTSDCNVFGLAPRSTVERGDQIVVRRRIVASTVQSSKEDSYIRVATKGADGKEAPIGQANVYYDGAWLGATASTGKLYLEDKQFSGAGILKVIKHGYGIYSKSTTLIAASKIEISLSQESAFLRIESVPTGAKVSVDGVFIGKTPVVHSAAVPSGFVKLEIDSPSGFKKFTQIMELDQGTLDLTGPRSIKLESDFKADVARLLETGKIEAAVARLEEVPESHSDYLSSQHQVGEIYLTMLNNPVKAAAAFSIVTSNPAIRDFNDKRFIGSHIDEGIAVFMAAENLAEQDKSAAAAHYQKAIDILEKVRPFLRFVQKDQYARAVQNVAFHKALAQHRLWQQSADQSRLEGVIKDWKEYLEGSSKEQTPKEESATLIENAKIYFQQAKASLAAKNHSM